MDLYFNPSHVWIALAARFPASAVAGAVFITAVFVWLAATAGLGSDLGLLPRHWEYPLFILSLFMVFGTAPEIESGQFGKAIPSRCAAIDSENQSLAA